MLCAPPSAGLYKETRDVEKTERKLQNISQI